MKKILILALFFAVGCAGGPQIPKTAQTQGDAQQVQALFEKAQALRAACTEENQIEPTIAAYEEVLKLAADHRPSLVELSLLYYYLGDSVLPAKDHDKRMAAHLRGRDFGLRALATNANFRAAYEKDPDMQKQIMLLGKDDVDALYWMGLNWAAWGELYGILRAAIDIPKVKAMMERVNALDESYYGNGADRFFVGYWMAIPSFAGRDPKKAQAAYDVAMKQSPLMLDTDVTYARYYAQGVEDRKLWKTILQRVVNAPADANDYPFRLANSMARHEAKEVLTQEKEIFE